MVKSKSVLLKRTVSCFIVVTLVLSLFCTGLASAPGHEMEQEGINVSEKEKSDRNQNGKVKDNPENSLRIVENGESKAVLVILPNMDPNIQYAVDLLVDYVEKSTGAVLQVKTREELIADEDLYEDMVRIFVGFTGPGSDPHIQADLEGMDDDGYIIRPHGNNITIIGPTTWGTRFGVNDFLEHYVGVRWLMPGTDGEDVPLNDNITVPRTDDIKEEPAFMMRVFSPLNSSSNALGYEWAYRNSLRSRVKFHHNINILFPSEEFGVSNPEFYPIRNGVTYIPPKGVKSGWQPRFTEPETVSVAVYKIIKYFDENPEETSFSLGVNDSQGYCEVELASSDKINSVGLKDMSDIYYKWVNDVVRGVREVYPDKWFGLLAYDNVADPPSFELDSHLVPFITKDRMAWIDPEVEAVGKEQTEKWGTVSENIGWYDYIYGLSYTLPRVYMNLMADNYRYAKENGVSSQYSELYPNWGEGPKAWVSAKLQWNPYLDVNALMNEWYERTVGIDAAPFLKQYYDHWETFWTERVQESTWFKLRKDTTYLAFNNARYLDLVTDEEIGESRRMLETVVKNAKSDKQKARANMLLRMFEYYEASALSYPKQYGIITGEAIALSLLKDGAMDLQIAMAERRYQLIDELMIDPVLKFGADPRNYGLRWNGLNPDQFWALVNYIKEYEQDGGAVTVRLNELANNPEESKMKEFAKLLLQSNGGINYSNVNPSFEDAILEKEELKVGVWVPWIKSGGTIKQHEGFARTGNHSLKIDNLGRGGPYQVIPVKPGLTAYQVYYYTPTEKQTKATIQLSVNLMDADKKVLSSIAGDVIPISNTAGEWAAASAMVDIPESAKDKEVKYAQVIFIINGLVDGVELYLDDAYVYQCNSGSEIELDSLSKENFWYYLDCIKQGVANSALVLELVTNQANNEEPSKERDYAKLLLDILADNINISSKNPSFEDTTLQWVPWKKSGTGTIERYEGIAHSGEASLRINSLDRGGPIQVIPVQPGIMAFRAYYYSEQDSQTAATLQISINLLDGSKKALLSTTDDIVTIKSTKDQWESADMIIDVPEMVNGVKVVYAHLIVTVNNHIDGSNLFIDDLEAYNYISNIN